MKEEWRPIPSDPRYQASSDGRIRNRHGHVLSTPASGRVPYCRVCLGRNNTKLVHRLIAETFLGLRPDQQVRHADGDSTNNCDSNLAVGSQADNERDKRRHGRIASGERNGSSKLTADQVTAIRSAQCGTIAGLARSLNISPSHAYNLRTGLWWDGV